MESESEVQPVRPKEKRLMKVYGEDVDPISYSYNKSESKNGRTYGLNSEMSVEDAKEIIGSNSDWLGLIIPTICLKLYVENKDGILIGPLHILDEIGKYLDGNESVLVIKVAEPSYIRTNKFQ